MDEALRFNDPVYLASLLSAGLHPDTLLRSRRTALHWVCKHKCYGLASVLIEAGAKLDPQDKNGQTPLQLLAHQASIGREKQNSVLKIAQLLISLHANVNLKDKRGYTALHYAVAGEQYKLVNVILTHPEVNIDEQASGDRETALFPAARSGNSELVHCLLQHGASVNMQSVTGETALHLAVCFGRYYAAQLLLGAGASVNSKSKRGRTPLHWAVYNGHADCAVLLTQHGADPTLRDWMGVSALSALHSCESSTAVASVNELRADRPWSLQYLCRTVIRATLGPRLEIARDVLNNILPPKLIAFVQNDRLL